MLTEEEKKLVTENYNLIYSYSHARDLDLEEYSGILSIGLCNAAIKYKHDRANFSTFAYRCMDTEVFSYRRKMNTTKRVNPEDIVFYHAEKDEGRSFLETFSTIDNVESETLFLYTFENEYSKLRNQAKRIVMLKFSGLTNNEITEKLGVRASTVSMALKKFKNALS